MNHATLYPQLPRCSIYHGKYMVAIPRRKLLKPTFQKLRPTGQGENVSLFILHLLFKQRIHTNYEYIYTSSTPRCSWVATQLVASQEGICFISKYTPRWLTVILRSFLILVFSSYIVQHKYWNLWFYA